MPKKLRLAKYRWEVTVEFANARSTRFFTDGTLEDVNTFIDANRATWEKRGATYAHVSREENGMLVPQHSHVLMVPASE